jgi:hypothetical protein
MSENYGCRDHEALIAYVYGEDDAGNCDRLAEHVAQCPSCAEEIAALRATRSALAAWSPPETALGFRISRASEVAPAPVLRPAAWWRQPLPAWAQAAAAVLMFAAGITVGSRQEPIPAPPATGAAATPANPRTASDTAVPVVSRDDLAALDQRLRTLETARVASAPRLVTAVRPVDEAELLHRVETMITASEQRQRSETARLVDAVEVVAQNIAAQRRADMERVERRIGQVYTPTEQVLRQHSSAINLLASFPQAAGAR